MMARLIIARAICLLLLVFALPAEAHKLAPALFKLSEIASPEADRHAFDVTWRYAKQAGASLQVVEPEGCERHAERLFDSGTAWHWQWQLQCPAEALQQGRFEFVGLQQNRTAVLVDIARLSGASERRVVNEVQASYQLPEGLLGGESSPFSLVGSYLLLGIEHILSGADHLLFVLGLYLLLMNLRRFVVLVTAFTLGHSLTLALVALDLVVLPTRWVEVLIAITLVWLALDVLQQRGVIKQYPYVVSLLFGLIHGGGFGNALLEIGLPQADTIKALLGFNLGVELGQIAFILVVVAVLRLLDRLQRRASMLRKISGRMPWQTTFCYVLGSVSVCWCLERLFL